MPLPLTRAQQLENAAFLSHLRRTGNVRAAAEALGCASGRFRERRRKHPAFAAQWDAALTLAHAALEMERAGAPPAAADAPRITWSSSGRRQLRRPRRGHIDHAGRQRFLAALSASANVVLSAAAAGYSTNALYNHRKRNPGFAREWRLALQLGYDRLEMALLAGAAPESFADDQWRRNDPPAIPPMTANQALQLMYLHQKEARLGGTPEPLRRRRGGEPGRTERAAGPDPRGAAGARPRGVPDRGGGAAGAGRADLYRLGEGGGDVAGPEPGDGVEQGRSGEGGDE